MGHNIMSALPSGPLGSTGLTSLNALQGQAKSKDPEVRRQHLAKVCTEMEGVFISQLLKQMRKTYVTSVNHHPENKEYNHLYEQQVAMALAQGGGIGLARQLYDSMQNRLTHPAKENQHVASRTESPGTAGDLPVPGTPGMSGTGSPSPGNGPGGDDPEPGRN